MRRLAYSALTLAACASAPAPHTLKRPAVAPLAGHAYLSRGDRARADAAQREADGAPGVFRSAQLRTQGLSRPGFSGERAVSGAIRLELDRPWHAAALTRSLRAREASAAFMADAAQSEAEALTCSESVKGRALAERRALAAQYDPLLRDILNWLAAFRVGGELDALTIERTDLSVRLTLSDLMVDGGAYRVHDSLGPLPNVREAHTSPLDRDYGRILAGIGQAHPRVQEKLREADRQAELANAEGGARAPFLDFVELMYDTRARGPEDLELRLALTVPLDDGSRGRKRRAQALSQGARFDAEAVAQSLTWSATGALTELELLERAQAEYVDLGTSALRATGLAARLVKERRGSPTDLGRLLEDALRAQLRILEAQERAGLASCTLRFATGIDYMHWPRRAAAASPAPDQPRTP